LEKAGVEISNVEKMMLNYRSVTPASSRAPSFQLTLLLARSPHFADEISPPRPVPRGQRKGSR